MKALRILIVLVVLFMGLAVFVVLYADTGVKQAVERGGSYALGVETTLGSADVGLFSGEFAMSELAVANPDGFERENFLAVGGAEMALALSSLTSDKIEIPKVHIDGIELDVERNASGTNYGAILENLERFESGESSGGDDGGGTGDGEADGGGKALVIGEILITNVHATVQMLPAGGELTRVSVTIPEVKIEDLDSEGLTMAELYSLVVKTLMQATLEAGGGVIPADLLADLSGKLEGLDQVAFELAGNVAADLEGKLEEAAGELQGELEEKAGELQGELEEKADEVLKDVEKGLGDLLGGDR